jgi:hypothetical protein
MSRTFEENLQFVSDFFMERDNVHETLRRITKRLHDEGIPYAVLGGMAVVAHGYVRTTSDVDILTTREGLDMIDAKLVGRGYVRPFPGARKSVKDTTTGVKVEFIAAGEYPGDGKPKAVVFPDPRDVAVQIGGYSYVDIRTLIELKLISGMSGIHRIQDIADVARLIDAAKLPRELGEQLDASVRDEYYKLWDSWQTARRPELE